MNLEALTRGRGRPRHILIVYDLLLMLGKQLSQYRILDRLGAGGMGEVYRALDEKLGREVAIKILPDEVRSDKERLRRFIQEAKTASSLKHQNAASIFELGEADGTEFIVMELVDGATLDQLYKDRIPPVSEIADIGIQIASALQEAHARGIVHRDIKPSNVMVNSRNQVKVLDFGLAKISKQVISELPDSTDLKTASGTIIGTIQYISPEQALGKEIDGRSDLFSVGVVLYQLATGKLPFTGQTILQMLDMILHQDPERPSKINPGIPPALERVILRCLEKDPSKRYSSASELIDELQFVKGNYSTISISKQLAITFATKRWPAALFFTLIVVAVLTALFVYVQDRNFKRNIHSIAVMPFQNSAKDLETEFLVDGITEGIIDRLSQLSNLRVMARSTVFTYKQKAVDPRIIGKELDVDALVIGSVVQRNDRIVIRAELVRAKDGSQMWGQQFDWPSGELPKVQAQISSEISEQLRSKFTGEQIKRITKSHTENTEAYQLYLRGRYYWNRRTAAGFQKAIEHYQNALQLDPRFALAYSGLAETYTLLPAFAMLPPKEGHPLAKEAARKALELDPDLVEAYAALAHTQHNYDWDWKGSEENYRKALKLNPNYAIAHHWYGSLLSEWGRKEEAIFQKKQALKLDPLSLILNADLGYIFYVARQYDAALEQMNRALELDPHFPLLRQYRAFLFQKTQKYDQAISELKEAADLDSESMEIQAQLAQVYALSGRKDEARRMLNDLLSSTKYVASFDVAMIYAGLGENDQAFEWLEKAFDERSYQVSAIQVEPRMDILRDEPRLNEMIQLLNIPQ